MEKEKNANEPAVKKMNDKTCVKEKDIVNEQNSKILESGMVEENQDSLKEDVRKETENKIVDSSSTLVGRKAVDKDINSSRDDDVEPNGDKAVAEDTSKETKAELTSKLVSVSASSSKTDGAAIKNGDTSKGGMKDKTPLTEDKKIPSLVNQNAETSSSVSGNRNNSNSVSSPVSNTRSTRSQNPEFLARHRNFLHKVHLATSSNVTDDEMLTEDDDETNASKATSKSNTSVGTNQTEENSGLGCDNVTVRRKRERSASTGTLSPRIPSPVVANTTSGSASNSGTTSPAASQMQPAMKKRRSTRSDSTGTQHSAESTADRFCWLCHKDGVVINCETCPRAYHLRCIQLDAAPTEDWVCPECMTILHAENIETRSRAMKLLSLDQLCNLLKYAVSRMKTYSGAEPFWKPVDLTEFSLYREYVAHPMDLSLLERNIKRRMYGSTEAFLADTKWLLHNCIIFNTYQSRLTGTAKMLVKICKQEMSEIENCPDCYLNAHTRKDSWFIEVCRKPHILVWAKLKGFPFWPAKVMRTNKEGMVDVRFFGAHDRAWVPVRECFLYSKLIPATARNKKRNNLEACIQEVEQHTKKLKDRYGRFEYASFRTHFDPSREREQLRKFLPGYNPSNDDGPPSAKRNRSLIGNYQIRTYQRSHNSDKGVQERNRSSLKSQVPVTEVDESNFTTDSDKSSDNRNKSEKRKLMEVDGFSENSEDEKKTDQSRKRRSSDGRRVSRQSSTEESQESDEVAQQGKKTSGVAEGTGKSASLIEWSRFEENAAKLNVVMDEGVSDEDKQSITSDDRKPKDADESGDGVLPADGAKVSKGESDDKTDLDSKEVEKSEIASKEVEKCVRASKEVEKSERASKEVEKCVRASKEVEKSERASKEVEKCERANKEVEKCERASKEVEKCERASTAKVGKKVYSGFNIVDKLQEKLLRSTEEESNEQKETVGENLENSSEEQQIPSQASEENVKNPEDTVVQNSLLNGEESDKVKNIDKETCERTRKMKDDNNGDDSNNSILSNSEKDDCKTNSKEIERDRSESPVVNRTLPQKSELKCYGKQYSPKVVLYNMALTTNKIQSDKIKELIKDVTTMQKPVTKEKNTISSVSSSDQSSCEFSSLPPEKSSCSESLLKNRLEIPNENKSVLESSNCNSDANNEIKIINQNNSDLVIETSESDVTGTNKMIIEEKDKSKNIESQSSDNTNGSGDSAIEVDSSKGTPKHGYSRFDSKSKLLKDDTQSVMNDEDDLQSGRPVVKDKKVVSNESSVTISDSNDVSDKISEVSDTSFPKMRSEANVEPPSKKVTADESPPYVNKEAHLESNKDTVLARNTKSNLPETSCGDKNLDSLLIKCDENNKDRGSFDKIASTADNNNSEGTPADKDCTNKMPAANENCDPKLLTKEESLAKVSEDSTNKISDCHKDIRDKIPLSSQDFDSGTSRTNEDINNKTSSFSKCNDEKICNVSRDNDEKMLLTSKDIDEKICLTTKSNKNIIQSVDEENCDKSANATNDEISSNSSNKDDTDKVLPTDEEFHKIPENDETSNSNCIAHKSTGDKILAPDKGSAKILATEKPNPSEHSKTHEVEKCAPQGSKTVNKERDKDHSVDRSSDSSISKSVLKVYPAKTNKAVDKKTKDCNTSVSNNVNTQLQSDIVVVSADSANTLPHNESTEESLDKSDTTVSRKSNSTSNVTKGIKEEPLDPDEVISSSTVPPTTQSPSSTVSSTLTCSPDSIQITSTPTDIPHLDRSSNETKQKKTSSGQKEENCEKLSSHEISESANEESKSNKEKSLSSEKLSVATLSDKDRLACNDSPASVSERDGIFPSLFLDPSITITVYGEEKKDDASNVSTEDRNNFDSGEINVNELRASVNLSKDISLTVVSSGYSGTSNSVKDNRTLLDMECDHESDHEDPQSTSANVSSTSLVPLSIRNPIIGQIKQKKQKLSSNIESLEARSRARKSFSNTNRTIMPTVKVKSHAELVNGIGASSSKPSVRRNSVGTNPNSLDSRRSSSGSLPHEVSTHQANGGDSIGENTGGSDNNHNSGMMVLPPMLGNPPTSATNHIQALRTVNGNIGPPSHLVNGGSDMLSSRLMQVAHQTHPVGNTTRISPPGQGTNVVGSSRMPPQLQPRPPGPLLKQHPPCAVPEAGPVSGDLNRHAHKLSEFLRSSIEEVLQDLSALGNREATIKCLQLELEKLQWRHNQEMAEMKHNTDLVVMEMRASMESERQRAVAETMRQCELEKQRAVEETKKKQWCTNCGKEALFYCCWNTSYCDYPCQQRHWPQHMQSCAQNSNQGEVSSTNHDGTEIQRSSPQTSVSGNHKTTSQQQQPWFDSVPMFNPATSSAGNPSSLTYCGVYNSKNGSPSPSHLSLEDDDYDSNNNSYEASQMRDDIKKVIQKDTDPSGNNMDGPRMIKKRKRCGKCAGCTTVGNCGQCPPCNSLRTHQVCRQRRCSNLLLEAPSNVPKRSRSIVQKLQQMVPNGPSNSKSLGGATAAYSGSVMSQPPRNLGSGAGRVPAQYGNMVSVGRPSGMQVSGYSSQPSTTASSSMTTATTGNFEFLSPLMTPASFVGSVNSGGGGSVDQNPSAIFIGPESLLRRIANSVSCETSGNTRVNSSAISLGVVDTSNVNSMGQSNSLDSSVKKTGISSSSNIFKVPTVPPLQGRFFKITGGSIENVYTVQSVISNSQNQSDTDRIQNTKPQEAAGVMKDSIDTVRPPLSVSTVSNATLSGSVARVNTTELSSVNTPIVVARQMEPNVLYQSSQMNLNP